MKFCLFADLHYWPGIFPNDTPEFLDRILKRAEDNKVDFVLHLGDFVHFPMRLKGFVDRYNDFHIPTYHTVGTWRSTRTGTASRGRIRSARNL